MSKQAPPAAPTWLKARRHERIALLLLALVLLLGSDRVTRRAVANAEREAGALAARQAAPTAPGSPTSSVDAAGSGGSGAATAPVEGKLGGALALHRVRSSAEIETVLGAWADPRERAFVAEQIFAATQEGPLPNVGALARIRVAAATVAAQQYPRLSHRLPAEFLGASEEREVAADGEAAEADPAAGDADLALFSASELRQLKPLVVVRDRQAVRSTVFTWALVVLAAGAAVHLAWSMRLAAADEWLLPAAFALVVVGMWMMVAVRDPLRDLMLVGPFSQGAAAGLVLCGVLAFVPCETRVFQRQASWALAGAVLLSLALLAFGTGPGSSDAKVNLFGFQPVEVIKILVVVFLAGYFAERWELLREVEESRHRLRPLGRALSMPRLEYLLPPVVAVATVLAFFFLQKDLGPALLISGTFLALYATARRRAGLALAGLGVLVLGFWIGYLLRTPATVRGRIEMWLSPWDNSFRGGDHLAHSLWAFASGGLFGRGLGSGQSAFVPEAHTDMVLAAVGEELGAIGVLLVLALYALIGWRALGAVRQARGAFSFFLGTGLIVVLALQIVLIVGGVLGVLPLSGVVTPFLSYGRSAMLANFVALGLLVAISACPAREQTPHRTGSSGSSSGAPGTSGAAVAQLRPALRWLAVGFSFAGVVLGARVLTTQTWRADEVAARATLALQADGVKRYAYNPRLLRIARQLGRGKIVDRNGIPLATSDAADLATHAATYSQIGLEPIAAQERSAVDERYYPLGGRAFHLLGDLNSRRGWGAGNTSYLERDQSAWLQGFAVDEAPRRAAASEGGAPIDHSPLLPLLRHGFDSRRKAVRALVERDRTLRTTLDARLQARAAEILAEAVSAANAERGAAVLLDAASGAVLATVSVPWPSRGEVAQAPPEQLLDRARYGLYPPGSTFKVVTAMAAQREHVADRSYSCTRLPDGRAGAQVRGWGRPVRDDVRVRQPHGEVDLERGIAVSCNAYFAQLAVYDVGARALLEVAAEFGIDVAAPNTPSQLSDALPQAAYGQGQVVASPFAMARVAASVANGGMATLGYWVEGEANDRVAAPRRLIDAEEAGRLARAMRLVVTSGSASRALGEARPALAGKTGTAEVAGGASHAWFVGFAPYGGTGRKVAVAVLIENGGYGGVRAASAAGLLVREAARLGLL